MHPLFKTALAATAICLTATGAAVAQDKSADDTFVERLYGREPGKGLTHACSCGNTTLRISPGIRSKRSAR